MTVKFMKFWNGRFPATVETFSKEIERRLVAADIALNVRNVASGRIYVAPTPTPEQLAYAEQRLQEIEAHKASTP